MTTAGKRMRRGRRSGYRQTEFASALHRHMEEWSEETGKRPTMWSRWTDGVYPEFRDLAEEVVVFDSIALHSHAAHIRSSQVFAFNLFLPFRTGSRERLGERLGALLGPDLTVERVQFEWIPPGALLCELAGERPLGDEPATSVDVVMWCRLKNTEHAAVLVEVKLTESEFTPCRGRRHPENGRKDVCKEPGRFFTEPEHCFVRKTPGKLRPRRYWNIFAARYGSLRRAFPGADPEGPCPFAGPSYQPMRNFALAKALELDAYSAVTRAWVMLCAHDDNPEIAEQWAAWAKLLPNLKMAPALPASEVVRAGEAEGHAEWADWMRKRYRLKARS